MGAIARQEAIARELQQPGTEHLQRFGQHLAAVRWRRAERDVEAERRPIRRHAVDQVDQPDRDRLVGPGPAEVGERHPRAGVVAQDLEIRRAAKASGAAVDEDAAVKQHRQLQLAGDCEHRLHPLVVRVPAGRHHLHAAQPECLDGMAQVVRRIRVARVDDREAEQAVGVTAHEFGEVGVGASQRRGVVDRIAVAQERREQDAEIDFGIVERAQHIGGALLPGGVQMGVDQHRRLSRGLTTTSRFSGFRGGR